MVLWPAYTRLGTVESDPTAKAFGVVKQQLSARLSTFQATMSWVALYQLRGKPYPTSGITDFFKQTDGLNLSKLRGGRRPHPCLSPLFPGGFMQLGRNAQGQPAEALLSDYRSANQNPSFPGSRKHFHLRLRSRPACLRTAYASYLKGLRDSKDTACLFEPTQQQRSGQ